MKRLLDLASNSTPKMSRRAGQAPGKTAFVLSGGSSLGAIQVGMIQALMEAGVRPDFLIGTSVGAINATWLAAQPDPEGAQKLAEIWCSLRRQDVFPFNPWAGALGLFGRTNHVISNSGLRSILEKNLPVERLEQTAVPVHVIATDLKNARAVMISSGPAIPALLASSAIPGVFPPVTIGRRALVDGGVANHTPIAAAIELGATRVIVLPVGYPRVGNQPTNALGMALHALARFVEVRLEVEVQAYRHAAEILVLPTVDTAPISPADFSRTPELIRLAYRSSRRYLAATASRPPALLPTKVGRSRQARIEPREERVAALKLVGLPQIAAPAAGWSGLKSLRRSLQRLLELRDEFFGKVPGRIRNRAAHPAHHRLLLASPVDQHADPERRGHAQGDSHGETTVALGQSPRLRLHHGKPLFQLLASRIYWRPAHFIVWHCTHFYHLLEFELVQIENARAGEVTQMQ
jgi:NTE family protein